MAPSMDFGGSEGHRPNGLAFGHVQGAALVQLDDAKSRFAR